MRIIIHPEQSSLMMKLITALTMMLKAALPMGRVQDVVATYN
jgi:hypothetical protein